MAMEIIITGGMITADQALASSLINHIFALEELIPFCKKIAAKIINNSPIAIAAAIKAINSGYKKEGFETEVNAFGKCFGTEDFKEGVSAFLEKRKADFKGE